MVTFAQAQERAERWVNGGPDDGRPRGEVRVREFDLGFVAWAEDRDSGPVGGGKLVIARDSGDTTLWPALPVAEVIQRYEQEYGGGPEAPPAEPAPQAGENVTSFMLLPPGLLGGSSPAAQMARPAPDAPEDDGARERPAVEPTPTPPPSGAPWTPAAPAPAAQEPPGPPPAAQPPAPRPPSPWDDVDATPAPAKAAAPASPWAGTDTSESGDGTESIAPPATVFAPPVVEDDETPAPRQSGPTGPTSEARTTVMPQGSALPPTAVHAPPPRPGGDAAPPPGAGPIPGPPGAPLGPPPVPGGGGDLAGADTIRAAAPGGPVPPPPAPDAADYVPTQPVTPEMIAELKAASARDAHGTPPPPPPPPPLGDTALAPRPGTGVPGPPPPPPGIGGAPAGSLPGTPPPQGVHTPPPPPPGAGYGYPRPNAPTVGSGYMAVLRYRAPDGSEQQLIRRSAPGMPHPEWQILHELRSMNVPPQQVIELHTELQSCELPGGYCARMVRETWPQVRITHTAAYGRDHASRQAGVRHLVEHQDELQQFADGPPRSAPVRAPLPQQQPAPAVALDVIGQELVQAYGPQAVFRYTPEAVSRQGVPEIVAQSLVWAGLPVDVNPFFWAQAQQGRPIPTLAELAAERGVQPAQDAGSYLVIGSDFGRQLCVQYGTAYIVAVPLEAGPGGTPAPPQFVNASLPQFARCMALLGRMWRLRYGLTPEQAGRWTTDFQAQLGSLDPQAVADPESWWAVLLEQMWDGLL
ncbi:SUKH-4 family immunity protein [Streptomyces sp. RFCAC02]|uniref:SUKH-4 family immunity protein n=1 Tax=Streptomyces sp. RFCAC02 TaxID=2499143 RepID=UPI00101FEEAA|nr:SUKH-4 family immunity protein [Streptomyces sp. RFCAC02]